MRMFAGHYSDTPHGESHGLISVSVLLTGLFIGAQGLLYLISRVYTPVRSVNPLYADAGFNSISAAIAVLLLVFLGVDLRRNRIEAHGRKTYQFVIFVAAAALLVAFLWALRLGAGVAASAG